MMTMEAMTAEQAIEAAKGLNFEIVWAAMMKTDARMEESRKAMDARMEESRKAMDARMEESRKEMDARMEESRKKTDKILADLSKQLGGLGNSVGRQTEALFSAGLCEKFVPLGFSFTRQDPRVKYSVNGRVVAEADFFLENGEYAMVVEIKTALDVDDVDEHLERIATIRQYMDDHQDQRKLLGAVAGGSVSESVLKYAQKKGLFVILQNGESVSVAATPQGFRAREW